MSVVEMRRFGEFLRSPLYNKNETLVEAFQLIRKYYPDLDHPKLERQELHKSIFPGEDFNEKKLRYLLTDMAKLLEQFLVLEEYREDNFNQNQHLLASYTRRGLDKYYDATLRRLQQAETDQQLRNSDFLWRSFKLEETIFQHKSSRKDHQVKTNLQKVVDLMDFHFLANKLKYSCEILNNKSVVNVNYELLLLEEILDYLNQKDLSSYPAIAVYYQILLTLREPEHTVHYDKLVEVLDQFHPYFPASEVFDMYVYAKNYCIIKINQGKNEYYRKLFEFYQAILGNRVIFKDGKLTQWDYKNIVTLGCRLAEYKWVENFMNEYKQHLGEEYRENAWRYNRANLAFFQKDYDRAISLLQEVDFTDIYYHLDSKSLLMKTYYEIRELESLQSLIDAFKVFLKRNQKIPEAHSSAYANQIYFVNKLLRHSKGKKVDLEAVEAEIAEKQLIADKNWLINKLEQAMNS